MLRILCVILVYCILAACSITNQTPAARSLRELGSTDGCTLIKTDEINNASFGAYPEVCKERAFSEMKNLVAQLGGNAYRYQIIQLAPCLMGGTTISFEAYSCTIR
ncbi:hypothetical protein ABXJ76_13220 [Methylobacter sp. G7]|uniref:hypothetical protein n=1 Tax=Methylobacter sp. G7 TaxID=3230117 RepID=UPI003D80883C